MIEDIVKIQALDASLETIEVYLVHGIGIDFVTQVHVLDMVVVTGLAPEQVDAQHTAIEAQVELLFVGMAAAGIDMLQVEGVTQEHPPPSHVWTQAIRGVWRKAYLLASLAVKGIDLIGVGVLQHNGIVVTLRFDIKRIGIIKLSEESSKHITDAMEKSLLMSSPRQAIGGIGLEHGGIE